MVMQLTDEQRRTIDDLAKPTQYSGQSKLAIFRQLPAADKPTYFREHFLLPLASAIAIVVLVVFLAVHILAPTQHPGLYVAVFDDALTADDAQILQTQAADALDLPEGRDGGVLIDTSFELTDSGLNKLQTLLANDEIDVIIAPDDTFETLCGFGYLTDLNESLDEEQRSGLAERFAAFAGFDDGDYEDMDYNGSGKGAEADFGLDLNGLSGWSAFASASDDALAGLAQDSLNTGNAQRFITLLSD